MAKKTSYAVMFNELRPNFSMTTKQARAWLKAWSDLMTAEILAGRSPIIGNIGMLYKHTRTKTNCTNPRTGANIGTKVIKTVRFDTHESLANSLN